MTDLQRLGFGLIGFAVAGPAWAEGRASLLNVLIDPAYRGQGLVWPLIAGVERELCARGIRELDIDARVGGRFRFVDRDYESAIEYAGQYIEIVPHRRLAFTLMLPGAKRTSTRVTVPFMAKSSAIV